MKRSPPWRGRAFKTSLEDFCALGQRARQQTSRDLDNRYDTLVGHACWPDYADRAEHFAVDFIRRSHDTALVERDQTGFATDVDLHALRATAELEQLQQAGALLEQVEQPAQVGHVRRQVLHMEQVMSARQNVLV